ncbi:MAG TPA: Lrp/AsnC family transcriptional regulator [Anaerolineae bacterium]|nr:Lrp/AsnC family transcriptional regulator [Anaerolineae bacterium]
MIEYLQTAILDDLDKAILQALQADGRTSNADLARQINLSPPAVHARIKRLEKHGYIRQYTALLDPEKAGYDMICFVHLSLQVHQHQQVETIRLTIQQMPEVLECYHLTGEFDYLMKVVVHNRQDLERFVMQRLTVLPGIARVQTGIVLSAVKSTTQIPL